MRPSGAIVNAFHIIMTRSFGIIGGVMYCGSLTYTTDNGSTCISKKTAKYRDNLLFSSPWGSTFSLQNVQTDILCRVEMSSYSLQGEHQHF